MKKTINIDIAGQLFKIDEDAYLLLSHYIDYVKERFSNEPGGEETITDIESRIAELFGGGQEPPVIITKEMIDKMTKIMGAPEDFYTEIPECPQDGSANSKKKKQIRRSDSSRSGIHNVLSEISKAFRKTFYTVFRAIMIVAGSVFSLFGFLMLFLFFVTLFFNNTDIVRDLFSPGLNNVNNLLSIVLNTDNISLIKFFAALVAMLPFAALTYLGIRMVFNLKNNSKVFSIVMFSIWIFSVAILGIMLGSRLSVYSNVKYCKEKITLPNPPDTLIISSLRKIDAGKLEEVAGVDDYFFFREKATGNLCAPVEISAYDIDSTGSSISINRRSYNKSDFAALTDAKSLLFNYKFSKDTLYLDEYFTVPGKKRWYGSTVKAELELPRGTILKVIPGTNLRAFGYETGSRENNLFRIVEGGCEEINEE